MPRDGSGNYTLPASYVATAGTVIQSVQQHNTPLEDIEADLNEDRPIVAGGTGASTEVAASDNLSTKGADIASASTTDLSAATGVYVTVTGTTTITAFGTAAAGILRYVRFSDVLTITHNASSLILPNGASVTTVAGDTGIFASEGGGNWRCIGGTIATAVSRDPSPQLGGDLDANGNQIQWSKGADVASAAALPILTDGNYFDVTGTTTITSINTAGGNGTIAPVIKLHFDGALTLTHHATDLILPSGANITTAAGDEAEFVEYASGDWRCTNYTKANGEAVVGSGTIVQVVNTQTGAVATGTTTIPDDDTIPQNTEGDQYMSLAITPTNASNRLLIQVVGNFAVSSQDVHTTALFQDSTANALAAGQTTGSGISNNVFQCIVNHEMAAGTTAATTFNVRAGNSSPGTTTFNGTGGARELGGVMASSITITEIAV